MYKGFEFKDLLGLEVMLFPKIATICYRLVAGISVLFGFIMVIRGIGAPWGGEVMFISGLGMMITVFYPVMV